ncbi:MAG: transcriptional repressor [Candidatus Latescibacteria bacterium]|nr:transcriptional repressor [Candidatus Latescibacterota bacterium]
MSASFLDKQTVFATYLRAEGLKVTPERTAVLDVAFSMPGHFAAEDLLLRLRMTGSRVSKATIYRTLTLLVRCGMLREVIFGEKHTHYEPALGKDHHDHLICLSCGKIIEFTEPTIEHLQETICAEYAFLPYRHKLEITGLCHECQQRH